MHLFSLLCSLSRRRRAEGWRALPYPMPSLFWNWADEPLLIQCRLSSGTGLTARVKVAPLTSHAGKPANSAICQSEEMAQYYLYGDIGPFLYLAFCSPQGQPRDPAIPSRGAFSPRQPLTPHLVGLRRFSPYGACKHLAPASLPPPLPCQGYGDRAERERANRWTSQPVIK